MLPGARGLLVAALLVSSCHWDWDALDPVADAQPRDGEPGDSASDGPRAATCSYTGSPGTDWDLQQPVPVVAVNTALDERAPFVTADGLGLYFIRSEHRVRTSYTPFIARKNDTEADFRATDVEPCAAALQGSGSVAKISVAADRLQGFLSAPTDFPTGAQGTNVLWWARRAQASETLSSFARVTQHGVVAVDHHEWDPFPSPDGRTLYFVQNIQEVSLTQLMVARREDVTSPVFDGGGPLTVSGLPPGKTDGPAVTADQRVLLFAHAPTQDAPADLYVATRSSTQSAFGAPVKLPAINSASAENHAYVSPDGCAIYYSSDRTGGAGGFDLYKTNYVQR